MCDVVMRRRALKAQQDCSYWSSTNFCKGFSKINDSFKYFLQKWIISHPNAIQSSIANYFIKIRFDDGNGLVKIELHQEALILDM